MTCSQTLYVPFCWYTNIQKLTANVKQLAHWKYFLSSELFHHFSPLFYKSLICNNISNIFAFCNYHYTSTNVLADEIIVLAKQIIVLAKEIIVLAKQIIQLAAQIIYFVKHIIHFADKIIVLADKIIVLVIQ